MPEVVQPEITKADIEASLYRPYKRWWVADSGPINVILIKREDANCIAACPALGLRYEHPDYLEASFELSRLVLSALNLPEASTFTSTCSAPFDLKTGEPLESRKVASPSQSAINPDIPLYAGDTDGGAWATPEFIGVHEKARSSGPDVAGPNDPVEEPEVEAGTALDEGPEPAMASTPESGVTSEQTVDEEQLDLFS